MASATGQRRDVGRSRWAAIGAAVAVALGGGGIVAVNAASSSPSSIVTIDPVRILDTRDPVDIGLPGPFVSTVSQKLQVTGGTVPAGATGVLLNVTVVEPTAAGFLSVRPGDADGAPSTSSLNFKAGDIVPNSVQVGLPTSGAHAGQIDITYDAFGQRGPTTEVLIDVVGYMSNAGLDALQAQINTKANAADVYTKAQTDAALAGKADAGAPIVASQAPAFTRFTSATTPTTLLQYGHLLGATGDGNIILGLDGPAAANGVAYRLQSVEWCLVANTNSGAYVSVAVVYHDAPGAPASPLAAAVSDSTDRTAAGCYTLAVPELNARGYSLALGLAGQTTNLSSAGVALSNVRATWIPRTVAAQTAAPSDESNPIQVDLDDLLPQE